MRKPRLLAPPWLIWFFFISHTAMWIVSFLQTIWIIYVMKKEFRVLSKLIKNKR
jgi:hypothetical protein